MKPSDIDAFFERLDRSLGLPAEIILTGAAAGALMGHVRPTLDIDFEIRVRTRKKIPFVRIEEAVKRAEQETGFPVQCGENIEGWSMISLMDYRAKAKKYKRIGKLVVKIMAPEYWTIGKIGRYLNPDIDDMINVIKEENIPCERLIKLWAKALRSSRLSLELGQFRDHAVDFLASQGKKIWGKAFNPDAAIRDFKKLARIP